MPSNTGGYGDANRRSWQTRPLGAYPRMAISTIVYVLVMLAVILTIALAITLPKSGDGSSSSNGSSFPPALNATDPSYADVSSSQIGGYRLLQRALWPRADRERSGDLEAALARCAAVVAVLATAALLWVVAETAVAAGCGERARRGRARAAAAVEAAARRPLMPRRRAVQARKDEEGEEEDDRDDEQHRLEDGRMDGGCRTPEVREVYRD